MILRITIDEDPGRWTARAQLEEATSAESAQDAVDMLLAKILIDPTTAIVGAITKGRCLAHVPGPRRRL